MQPRGFLWAMLVAAWVSPAWAAMVAPGSSMAPESAASGSLPLEGTTLATDTSAFAMGLPWGYPAMTGTLESRVVRTEAGTLDFYYRVTNLMQNTPVVAHTAPVAVFHSFELQGFQGLMTDVYALQSGGTAPGTVSRNGWGATITPLFAEIPYTYPYSYTLQGAGQSVELLVRTDATAFQSASMLLNGSVFDARYPATPSFANGVASALVPGGEVFAVPEASAMATLPLAIAGLLWRLRRR